jgi:hypothetical protein
MAAVAASLAMTEGSRKVPMIETLSPLSATTRRPPDRGRSGWRRRARKAKSKKQNVRQRRGKRHDDHWREQIVGGSICVKLPEEMRHNGCRDRGGGAVRSSDAKGRELRAAMIAALIAVVRKVAAMP